MLNKIRQEIQDYHSSTVDLFEGHAYSMASLVRRINLFKANIYPTGRFDSQGRYKYWFDIIKPRVNGEVKNIDFDTKDIVLDSEGLYDGPRLLLANAGLVDWMRDSGEAEKINTGIERGSEWGSVAFKKVKGGYRVMDLTNFYVLNTTAETLEDSDVIEMETMYPADLMRKKGVWNNIDGLIASGKTSKKRSTPEFYIYERNGEVTEKELFEAMDKPGGDESKYVLAKVIVGGAEKGAPSHILYADYLSEKPYKEAHRTPYAGTWLRMGLYQLLMDVQTRANEIGNQIARGLECFGTKQSHRPAKWRCYQER
jgi:hypothetical protein